MEEFWRISLLNTGKLHPVGSVSEGREPALIAVARVVSIALPEFPYIGIWYSLVGIPPSFKFFVDIKHFAVCYFCK